MNSTTFALCCSLLSLSQLALGDDAPKQPDDFLSVTKTHFATWDSDHDGILVISEINSAVANPEIRGSSAAAIAALKRATRSTRYKLPALSLANISELVAAKASPERPDLPGIYRNGLDRIEQANRELYVSGKPRLDTVHQGKLGNCYCLAPLGAVLHVAPDRISQMFTRSTDGSFQVCFGPQTVNVALPTDAEIAQTSSNERDGIWINLYEKAVGEARNAIKPADQRGPPIDVMARGGSAGTMLSYITGHKIQRFSFVFAKRDSVTAEERTQILAQLRTYITEAVQLKRAMTCGTEQPTTPGITPNHAYAVLSYDSATDSVQLWDPHGGQFTPKGASGHEHGYARKDGVFSIPLEAFVVQYAGMARETDLPAGDEPELPKLPLLTTAAK